MTFSASTVLTAVALGAGATLAIDVWNLVLRRAFGVTSLNYCLLGRWVRHMAQGTFRHANIAAAAPRPFECPTGWIAHYGIGIGLAWMFLAIAPPGWSLHPTPWLPLVFGIGTVVFPLFVLQPAFGLGLASARTPHPARARMKSLGTHTVFGVGLYACAVALHAVL